MGPLRGYIEYLLFPLLFLTKSLKNISYIGLIIGVFLVPVSINAFTIPIISSCKNLDDDTKNNTSPGVVIDDLDGASSSTSMCMVGDSDEKEASDIKPDYYYFKVYTETVVEINASSPNNQKYHLKIGKTPEGTEILKDTKIETWKSGKVTLKAGEGIYIYIKETGTEKDEYRLDISVDPKDNQPPYMETIPDQVAPLNQNYSLDLSQYVHKTDGDDITQYNLTCLPNNFTFDQSTGILSGVAQTSIVYNCSATAEDKDGLSNSSPFKLTLGMEIVENADDLCYEDPISLGGLACSITNDISQGYCTAGTGCGIKFPLKNIGDSNLTDVHTLYREDQLSGSFGNDCGVDPSGTCASENDIDMGPFGLFGKSTKFDLANAIPPQDNSNSIWVNFFVGMSCFKTDYLYGQYVKDGKLHRGPLKPCSAKKYKCAKPHKFETRFQNIVAGDLIAIGNSNICADNDKDGVCDTDQKHRNDTNQIIFINAKSSSAVGSEPATLENVSGAELQLPKDAEVVWAGLYWQGSIWDFNEDNNAEEDKRKIENGTKGLERQGLANTIMFKTPGGSYQALTADEHYYLFAKRESHSVGSLIPDYYHINRYEEHYQGFKDVTDLVKNAGSGTYYVGNIQATTGTLYWSGVEAGWTLHVIYEYPNAKTRSIAINDGYVMLYGGNDKYAVDYANEQGCPTDVEHTGIYDKIVDFEIKGFMTPKTGDFDTDLTAFMTDPDNDGSDDGGELDITRKDGSTVMIDGGGDTWIPTITKKDESENLQRTPAYVYPIGMAIRNYTNTNVLDPEQTSTKVTFKIDNDHLVIGVIGFATDLRVPDVCYDYTMFVDNYKIESTNNEIETQMGAYNDKLINRMYIRSREGNFNLTDANLTYHLPQPNIVSYDVGSLEIAQNGQYNYEPADSSIIIHEDNSTFSMRIGEGSNSDIYPLESRYIAFTDTINDSANDTYFTLKLDAKVDYGVPGVPPIPFSKVFGADDICGDDNGSYNVQYTIFNVVEPQLGYDTYNLFTKVAGQEIDYDVYAYKADNPSELLDIDLHMPVEVEMIRADDFDRNASISCGDERAVLPEDIIPHKVVYIEKNKGSFKFLPSETNFAYPSLSLRVHYFVDDNNSILTDHNCSSANTNECKDLYSKYSSTLTNCNNDCASTSSGDSCYACLKKFYDNFSCARDNFTLRPRAFRVALKDSNQSDTINGTATNDIAINDTSTASAPANIVAGYKYRLDINATSKTDPNNAIPLYIQPFTDTHNKRVAMIWSPDPTATNCVDTDDKNLTFVMYNGSTAHPISNTAQTFNIKQIGDYKLEIYDQNLTRYDWHSNYTQHHYKDHFISDSADCIKGNNGDIPNSDGRVGCVTDNNLDASDAKYLPIYERVHPYSFDISGINIGGAPTNDKSVVYYNTLDGSTAYPQGFSNTGDKNMSYNVQGTFFAIDYEGDKTTNFVQDCYAEDVNIVLKHRYISPIPNESNTQLVYDLVDYNTTNPNTVYRSDRSLDIASRTMPVPSETDDVDLVITQHKSDFTHDMQGAITMDLGYNFTRDISTAQNPRLINFKDFNVTYATQPTNVHVAMKSSYEIAKGDDSFDQNITFAYAKVATSKFLYDDIKETSVKTPIYVHIYCNLDYSSCIQRGLDLNGAITNDSNWWKAINHNNLTKQDGNIELSIGTIYQGAGSPYLSSTTVDINNNGVNDSIEVNQGANPTLPLEVGINLVTDPTQPNYTDRWLIYNKDDNTQAPIPFYKVRFIGDSTWSGVGKTGNVVGTDAASKKTKRLDW